MIRRARRARSGRLPTSGDYAYEVKWDGFRAIVSTDLALRVRNPGGWDMTEPVRFLAELPVRAVFDGELVVLGAWRRPLQVCSSRSSGSKRGSARAGKWAGRPAVRCGRAPGPSIGTSSHDRASDQPTVFVHGDLPSPAVPEHQIPPI